MKNIKESQRKAYVVSVIKKHTIAPRPALSTPPKVCLFEEFLLYDSKLPNTPMSLTAGSGIREVFIKKDTASISFGVLHNSFCMS
jgi:hypothetical protein